MCFIVLPSDPKCACVCLGCTLAKRLQICVWHLQFHLRLQLLFSLLLAPFFLSVKLNAEPSKQRATGKQVNEKKGSELQNSQLQV